MGMPSMPELLVILLIVLLLFGAKKIPDLARGLGSGIKNFKNAIKDDEDKPDQKSADQKNIEADKQASSTTGADKPKVS